MNSTNFDMKIGMDITLESLSFGSNKMLLKPLATSLPKKTSIHFAASNATQPGFQNKALGDDVAAGLRIPAPPLLDDAHWHAALFIHILVEMAPWKGVEAGKKCQNIFKTPFLGPRPYNIVIDVFIIYLSS